jgi:hypothetical protein
MSCGATSEKNVRPTSLYRSSASIQHTSAYVSIRQHTSAYGSIRQHTACTAHLHRFTEITQDSTKLLNSPTYLHVHIRHTYLDKWDIQRRLRQFAYILTQYLGELTKFKLLKLLTLRALNLAYNANETFLTSMTYLERLWQNLRPNLRVKSVNSPICLKQSTCLCVAYEHKSVNLPLCCLRVKSVKPLICMLLSQN